MWDKLWYILTCALDTLPLIYLLYRPMRPQLRLPMWLTLSLHYAVMLGAACGVLWLLDSPYYSLGAMLAYRLFWVLVVPVLSMGFIRTMHTKALFVFFLLFPFLSILLLIPEYVAQFWGEENSPPYMVSSLIRSGLMAVVYPFLLLFWNALCKRTDKIVNRQFWDYAWAIPASVGITEMLLIRNTYETGGVLLIDLLGQATLCIGSAFTAWLLFFVADHTESRAQLEEAKERNELLLEIQARQYEEMAADMEATRIARHDLRHHLNTIKTMLDDGETSRLQAYLEEVLEHLPRQRRITICENYTANAVLEHVITRANELNVPIKVNFQVSRRLGIADSDLCVLLGNALENALDATQLVAPDKRFIIARALEEADRVYLTFDNSFDGELRLAEDDAYLSRKRGYTTSGVGITSIRAIVKNYGGDLRITAEDGVFRLSLLLYKKP